MKIDRGIIKWAPFNSVTPSKDLINRLANEKLKVNKPILSEEQLNMLQKELFEAYNNELEPTIKYYKNGIIFNEKAKIKVLDLSHNRLILNTNKIIYFNQIVKIINY